MIVGSVVVVVVVDAADDDLSRLVDAAEIVGAVAAPGALGRPCNGSSSSAFRWCRDNVLLVFLMRSGCK